MDITCLQEFFATLINDLAKMCMLKVFSFVFCLLYSAFFGKKQQHEFSSS